MQRIAFIGLGRMGHGMAGRYLDGGFEVAVWNRSKAKADDLIARGARWAASPADAASSTEAKSLFTSASASTEPPSRRTASTRIHTS